MIVSRLKEVIKEKGVSSYQISKDTGMSEVGISRILNGKSTPRNKTIKILANYLEVSEEWIITGKGKKYVNSNDKNKKIKNFDFPPVKITKEEIRKLAIFAVMYKDDLEKNIIFQTYLKTIRDEAIIEYQKELMKEYQQRK